MKKLKIIGLGGWNLFILHTGEINVFRIEMNLSKPDTTPLGMGGKQFQDLVQDMAILGT